MAALVALEMIVIAESNSPLIAIFVDSSKFAVSGNSGSFFDGGARDWNRFANFSPAEKIPFVRKSFALLRLHRLQRTIAAIEKKTFAVWFVDQRQPVAILPQSRVTLHEIEFANAEKRRDPRNIFVGNFHKSRPAAAVRASLAFIENFVVH